MYALVVVFLLLDWRVSDSKLCHICFTDIAALEFDFKPSSWPDKLHLIFLTILARWLDLHRVVVFFSLCIGMLQSKCTLEERFGLYVTSDLLCVYKGLVLENPPVYLTVTSCMAWP